MANWVMIMVMTIICCKQISPASPDRLKPDNYAQVTKDNPGDMSFELNNISPCISP
jgi:hypothetical protein